MKKIIRKAVKEVSEYRSDFSGKKFAHGIPPVRISLEFGYGSRHDCARLDLDVSETEALEVVEFLAKRLCHASRESFRKKIRSVENGIDDAIAARDWQDAESLYGSTDIFRKLAGIEEAKE